MHAYGHGAWIPRPVWPMAQTPRGAHHSKVAIGSGWRTSISHDPHRTYTYVRTAARARACACAVGCVLDNSACSRDGTARLQGPEAAGNCQPPANCSITETGNIPRPMATHGRRSSAAVALIHPPWPAPSPPRGVRALLLRNSAPSRHPGNPPGTWHTVSHHPAMQRTHAHGMCMCHAVAAAICDSH